MGDEHQLPEPVPTEDSAIMKTRSILAAAALFAALAALTGCGDNSSTTSAPPPPPAAPPAAAAAPKPVEPPKPVVEAPKAPAIDTNKVVEVAKTAAQEAAKVAKDVAADVAAAAQKQFDATVAEVKALLAEGKGSEALAKIQSAFSSMKLSGDQQSVVDGLKKQIQETITKTGVEKGVDAASKAVGNLFKPKPQN